MLFYALESFQQVAGFDLKGQSGYWWKRVVKRQLRKTEQLGAYHGICNQMELKNSYGNKKKHNPI